MSFTILIAFILISGSAADYFICRSITRLCRENASYAREVEKLSKENLELAEKYRSLTER